MRTLVRAILALPVAVSIASPPSPRAQEAVGLAGARAPAVTPAPENPAAHMLPRPRSVVGLEARLGGDRLGPLLGAGLGGRWNALRYGLAAELHGLHGEYAPALPGESLVLRTGIAVVASGGWTGAVGRADFGGGVRPLRVDALGEAGYEAITVDEWFAAGDGRSDLHRVVHLPFVGARLGAAFQLPTSETGLLAVGLTAFARRALASPRCVATSGGCEEVPGWTTGAALSLGIEGRLR